MENKKTPEYERWLRDCAEIMMCCEYYKSVVIDHKRLSDGHFDIVKDVLGRHTVYELGAVIASTIIKLKDDIPISEELQKWAIEYDRFPVEPNLGENPSEKIQMFFSVCYLPAVLFSDTLLLAEAYARFNGVRPTRKGLLDNLDLSYKYKKLYEEEYDI
jgi:hypothetical protein